MDVKKKGKVYYVRFRQGDGVELAASTRTPLKRVAVGIAGAIDRAVRTRDYASLDPEAREVAMRLFKDKLDDFLPGLRKVDNHERGMSLWEAMQYCLTYPEITAKGEEYRDRLKGCFCHLVLKLGKDRNIQAIGIRDLEQYKSDRLKEDAAPGTVNKELTALSKLFSVLVKNDFLDRNIVREVPKLSEKDNLRQVYVAYSDFAKVLTHLPDWYAPMVLTAYYTGMRQGEIRNLTRSQLDLDRRVIRLGPKDTKERSHKRVPIHDDLVPVLEHALSSEAEGTDNVFLRDGKPIPRTQMRRYWESAVRNSGLPSSFHFHDIRHVWKGNARRSGIDPEIREDIMGHWWAGKNVNTRYGFISNDELVQAIDRFTVDNGDTEIWVPERKKKTRQGQAAGKKWGQFGDTTHSDPGHEDHNLL
ncbi:MAG: site-specific integrase [Desulfomonile tiedjei]|uniref:Site-specific integrase n=1 Tax=Desulfomonile tiedjei TaxID=2358 RepID=A0A9D6Z303_9BACT|nr:site-specific integrase [Desulfomonile tiedjei]